MFLAFLAHTARKSAKRWPLRLSKRWQAQSYFVYMYTYMPREWFTRCQTFMLGICKWAWFTIALSSSYIALLPIPTPTFLHRFPGIFAANAKKCYYLCFGQWSQSQSEVEFTFSRPLGWNWFRILLANLLILNFQENISWNWRSIPKSNAITVRIRPYCAQ